MEEDSPSPHLPAEFQAMLNVIDFIESYNKIFIVAAAVKDSFKAA